MVNSNQVELSFKNAPDGPSIFCTASQLERFALRASLDAAGVAFSRPNSEMAFDSAEHLLKNRRIGARLSISQANNHRMDQRARRSKICLRVGNKRVEAATIKAAEQAWKLICESEKPS